MNKISAVIIDDEFFNRKLISMLITKINPVFSIDGEAENVRDGFSLIKSIKPDIVFLDIKMPDGSGFELLKLFPAIDFEVVFITGFDEYILKAFEFNALDYVLKPIDTDKFKIMLDKVEDRLQKKTSAINLERALESYNNEEDIITKLPVYENDTVILLDLKEIMYIQSIANTTFFTRHTSEKYTSVKQLADIVFILENFQDLIRINKSTYINVNFISAYSKGFDHFITMKDRTVIKFPSRKKTEILKLLRAKNKN